MRVALVVPSFPKLSETFIVSKFLGLLEKGVDVFVICDTSQQKEWEYFPNLERVPDIKRRIIKNWRTTPKLLAALQMFPALIYGLLKYPKVSLRYLRCAIRDSGLLGLKAYYLDLSFIKVHPDIIHFEFGALSTKKTYLKERMDCKVVCSFRGHDIYFVGLENPKHYSNVWRKNDAVHCLGEDLWQRVQERGCSADKPHVLIPPAIDENLFTPSQRHYPSEIGSPERPLRILSVGRLVWAKGYEYALQSIRDLVDAKISVEYRIAGDGIEKEAISFCIHQLSLEKFVQILGDIPPGDIHDLMDWADLLLHTAVEEGFCNAVIEAQAMQLPVVCSDAGGLPENVVDNVTAFVVPRREPKQFSEKIIYLTRHSALRKKMGEAGRKRVLERYRLSDQISSFVKFYQTVMDLPD
jgi:colanic acid/amylovoran biosynthesis glycosyltransferase